MSSARANSRLPVQTAKMVQALLRKVNMGEVLTGMVAWRGNSGRERAGTKWSMI